MLPDPKRLAAIQDLFLELDYDEEGLLSKEQLAAWQSFTFSRHLETQHDNDLAVVKTDQTACFL